MYQMHGEKPSHSILSGYLNDRYKLTFDHFGWEDQYWLWKWPQLSFSTQKLPECLKAESKLWQSDSTWVAALSEVRDWKTGWIWGKLTIYFCLWFTTLSQHMFFEPSASFISLKNKAQAIFPILIQQQIWWWLHGYCPYEFKNLYFQLGKCVIWMSERCTLVTNNMKFSEVDSVISQLLLTGHFNFICICTYVHS